MPSTDAHFPKVALNAELPIALQLLSQLRKQIIRGEIAPGQQLSEASMASQLDISRQPVREAFIKLKEMNLLEIRPQRGTYVPQISFAQVEESRFLREAIEADVVRLAAERFGPAEIAELEARYEAHKAAEIGPELLELDDEFHRALTRGIGREGLWNTIVTLKAQFDRVRYLHLQDFPRKAITEQHLAVLDAIRAHDPDAAERAMRLHLREIIGHLPALAARHPDYFADAIDDRTYNLSDISGLAGA